MTSNKPYANVFEDRNRTVPITLGRLTRLEAKAEVARAMLAALVRIMAEADFGDETLLAEGNAAIAAAEAAGIKAEE